MYKVFGIAVAFAALATASAASARMTDREFLQANRCRGLAGSTQLGAVDTTVIDGKIREESHARDLYIMERAEAVRQDAERDARHASDTLKARLIAERNGVCASYLS